MREGGVKRRRRRRDTITGVASSGNIGLHLVCHGKRITKGMAPQDRKRGHSGMPLPEQSGRHTVEEAGRVEEGPRERVGGLGDETLEKQKEGEKGGNKAGKRRGRR